MRECNRVKTMGKVAVGLALLFTVIFFPVSGTYRQWKEDNSGVPDAVSSMSDGTTCRLTVVANSSTVEEKQKFAEKVVEMCRSNSFRSLRFSTDAGEWPEKLDIRVYLRKRDIGEEEPLMQILYEPVNDGGEYDIRDDREKYRMVIRKTGGGLL